jgi:hypothetical protein
MVDRHSLGFWNAPHSFTNLKQAGQRAKDLTTHDISREWQALRP